MVGIDISDKSIKVAEVTRGETPTLKAVGWSSVPVEAVQRGFITDIGTVVMQVANAMANATPVPIVGKRVTASISEVQSFVSVVEVPRMSSREIDEAVQWAVQQHLPFDLERVYLDWQLLTNVTDSKVQVLVGAAQRAVADPLLAVLDGLAMTTVALELEAQAIVRSLLPLNATDVQGILIVDLGAISTNVIYFDQGTMRFTTSLPEGGDTLTRKLAESLGISLEAATEQKALVGVRREASNQTVAVPLRAATKALVERVGQIARDIVRQVGRGAKIQAILLAGGAANLPGLAEVFADVFPGVPVQLGNPWTNLLPEDREGEAPLSTEDAAHFATALGLALRTFEYE